MRRGALALAVLGVLCLQPVSALAQFPTPTKLAVSIQDQYIGRQSVQGRTDASQLVELRVLERGGAVKAIDRTLSDASGDFALDLGTAVLAPGDTVEIVLGGNPEWTYRLLYSLVRLTGLDMAAGTITGTVTPRKPRIQVILEGTRVIPDPLDVARTVPVSWQTAGSGKLTEPTGRFVVKPELFGLGWEGSYRRRDLVVMIYRTSPVAGDAAYSFTVYTIAFVPGCEAAIGTNALRLYAALGRSYSLALMAPGGAVKASERFSYSMYDYAFPFYLYKPDGTPAVISTGDTIRVDGVGGFTIPVPVLRAAIGVSTDRVRVFGPPGARIHVDLSLYDDEGDPIPAPPAAWVRTNAAGEATLAPAGVDLRHGDRVTLQYVDGRGNMWWRHVQSLPAR